MNLDSESVLTPSDPIPDRVTRAELDYYPTPEYSVIPVLPLVQPGRRVLDPACGKGELLKHFVDRGCELAGIEVDSGRAKDAALDIGDSEIVCADALAADCDWPAADLIFMNPPFSHGEQFVRKALSYRAKRRSIQVAVLLRLSFMEPTDPEPKRLIDGRAQLWRELEDKGDLPFVGVLPQRPKYRPGKSGKMGTDNVTSAWFVWSPIASGRWGMLR